MTGARFDELLRCLAEAGTEFVLVGGLAMNAWGVVRGTRDVDVVPDPAPENRRRLADTAAGIGGQAQTREAFVSSALGIAALLDSEAQVHLETELGALDVILGLPGVPPFAELRARAKDVDLLGVRVAVCSLEDLRAMKRAAGRTRDLADLEDLDSIYGRSDAG